eukprot:6271900-Prymnesium_polylepis.1
MRAPSSPSHLAHGARREIVRAATAAAAERARGRIAAPRRLALPAGPRGGVRRVDRPERAVRRASRRDGA